MQDHDAYVLYSHHRKWYNKLWFSEQMGYYCGPGGIPPHKSSWYVARPIMNLRGMGIGSRKVYIERNDNTKVGPGEFWCEWFDASQYSVDFINLQNRWVQSSCYRADRDDNKLSKFKKWTRYEHKVFSLDTIFDELLDLNQINVEFIGDNPIEVHLRTSEDPKNNELIPIWSTEENMIDIYLKMGYKYIESYDDCDGFLNTSRTGFMVR